MNGFVREVSLKNPRRANQLIKLTNKFHVAVSLFNNRSQMTWKSGKNKKVAHKLQQSVSFIFLMNTDVFHNLSLYRPMETWNQFVLNDKEARKIKFQLLMVTSSTYLSSYEICPMAEFEVLAWPTYNVYVIRQSWIMKCYLTATWTIICTQS